MARRIVTVTYFAVLAASLAGLASCAPGGMMPGTAPISRAGETAPLEGETGQLGELQRQLVRRGELHVEVEELAAARARLERSLEALGGRVAHLEARTDERADYSLRVPAARLEALMDSVSALGRVESRTVSAIDVTEQVVDAEGRLAALRASRDRLLQLMQRATTVQEVITVERELARVQGELESLEGRLNAVRSQIALSELSVRLKRRVVLGPLGVLLQGVGTVLEKLFVWRR